MGHHSATVGPESPSSFCFIWYRPESAASEPVNLECCAELTAIVLSHGGPEVGGGVKNPALDGGLPSCSLIRGLQES